MIQSNVIDLIIMQGLMQNKLSFYHVMSYLASNLIFSLKNCVKMVVLGKDFNLGAIAFYFMLSPIHFLKKYYGLPHTLY
jgi:hypothetical protein